jgi:hypothetical protein
MHTYNVYILLAYTKQKYQEAKLSPDFVSTVLLTYAETALKFKFSSQRASLWHPGYGKYGSYHKMGIQLKYVIPLMVHHSECKLVLICHLEDIYASDGYDQC